MVLHLLVYLIHVYDQLGETLVFCACSYINKKSYPCSNANSLTQSSV